ncbi:hypothetical protein H2201_002613 [Coniosporium apollinis]|uniref:Fungal N-terminal domain-containing protein n=1 Tax=Coniosporium apollinis TaxID=61459 RepID=A0ABQ9NYF6_9PEZI|nr:hypothetical protein H2201_002613 [Coniosporium apollinis]
MAEVIALTAAAVQFLDVGGRVLVAFSSLCSSLKRVPAKVKAEIQQLEHVLIVLRTIETDIAVPNNGLATTLAGVLTQTQINEAKALLNDAVSQAKELEVILRSLVPPTQESTLRKAWRMIISQQKEEEILERCNGLEKVKSTIQLWQERCNYARLVLIEGHILAGRGFEDGVRSINQNIGAMSGELSAFKSSAANAHVTVKNEDQSIGPNLAYKLSRSTTSRIEMTSFRRYGKSVAACIFDKREASSALSDTIVPGVWRLEPRIRMRDAEKRSAIARDLIAYGCDMVVTSKHGGFLGGLVDACIADPGLVNDLLLGEVCLAAAKRSETHLRQLIANGHDVNRGFLIDNSNSILLTPVNFALEWSTGLQILFEAGADPSAIIEGSVPHIEDASVMALLLAYGYPIFPTTPNWELETLMHHALFSKTGMLDALVERLAHDRRQLMALASAQLSFDEQETIGLNAFGGSLGLLDRHAKSVIDALETRGVDVPAKIWPGHQKTVFHLADLTREGAQKLFAAGFRDVDAEDEDVYTPLTEACCSGEWGLVEWYLEKGADPRAVVKAGFINLPHLIAYTTAYRRLLEGFSLERIWPSKDEQLELREEDVKLKDILEAYMHLYHDLRSEYSGRFSLFWSAWWEAVSDHLPEDPLGRHGHRCRHDQLVSEEELERHEFAVGLGYEPDDEAIRTRMRDLLPLGFGVDPAEIFSDGVSNLFDG